MADLANQFRLSEAEAITLAVAKLWLMARDAERDPDLRDRQRKGPVLNEYASAVLAAQAERATASDEGSADPLALIGEPDWPARMRNAMAAMDSGEALALLVQSALLRPLLTQVDRRDRAILLLIELAAFYPWPRRVRWEERVRRGLLHQIVRALAAPVTVEYFDELDRQLLKRMRTYNRRNLDWKKLTVLAGGATALGVITGGLAAPLIGGAIGGAMGLSGAAATSAGLALLGGGSLAAGGMGMAGGAALVSGALGAAAGSATGGISWWKGVGADEVLVESVKLEVVTEYLVVREQGDNEKARLIVRTLEGRLETMEAEVLRIRRQLDRLRALKKERDELKTRVEELEQVNGHLRTLIGHLSPLVAT